MRHRSPARILAPLALLAAALAVFLIVSSGSEDGPVSPGGTAVTTSTSAAKRPKKPSTTTATQPSKAAETYTVRSGDTLSAIAGVTGVPVESLLQFNPGVDANTLRVGQKLKLAE